MLPRWKSGVLCRDVVACICLSVGFLGETTQKIPFDLVDVPEALTAKTIPDESWRTGVVGVEVVAACMNRDKGDFGPVCAVREALDAVD